LTARWLFSFNLPAVSVPTNIRGVLLVFAPVERNFRASLARVSQQEAAQI
jgi:hypothetical protein